MKRLILIASAATTVVPPHAQTCVDNASGARVERQSESIRVPRHECNNGWIREPGRSGGRGYGGASFGGAGALIRNQVGGSQHFTTLMHKNPGGILPVRVFVVPVGP